MKRPLIILAAVLVLAAGIWAYRNLPGRRTNAPRRAWAAQAITDIRQRASDERWLAEEIARVKALPRPNRFEGGWFSDGTLLMDNGEWIVARNICSKQVLNIPDLFVGQASDGKWYYSTFHFCIGMDVLHMEPQPRTLDEFVRGYWLVPFNGEPQNCLDATWTSGAYGRQITGGE